MRKRWLDEDPELVLDARVAERGAQEEAVELRLGERERPLVLDRVLGRENEERVREAPRVTPSTVTCRSAIASSSADCVFGVARLISSTRTTFAKIGPGRNSKLARLLVEDREPGDVGRLEVGRALDALRDRALDAAGDRAREHGLRRARHVLEEDVPVAGERGQDELDLVALAVDDRLDVVDEAIGDRAALARSARARTPVREPAPPARWYLRVVSWAGLVMSASLYFYARGACC